ncbi:MAG TPA: EboA domain-containing protein [Xanthobacteraceae bacterium]|nr:EboA domain-containing protein [Xanthobacteraceae bacterium]
MPAAEQQISSGVDPAAVIPFLRRLLGRVLAPAGMQWLDQELDRQRSGLDERRLAIALGLATRKVGRMDLAPPPDEVAAAERLRPRWQPQLWGTDEAARVALVLATYRADDKAFAARIDRLCATGELTEQVAYLKGFAIFPAAGALHDRAREAVRSSIAPVFEAIACGNPYPHDHFDESAWNQMVVKCVFSGLPIASIVGLRERRNGELIAMLRDLVSERTAAGRATPDEVHGFIAGG